MSVDLLKQAMRDMYSSEGVKLDSMDFNNVAHEECRKNRDQLLKEVFSGMAAYSKADKAVISEHFANGGPGQHESHSPLLTSKTASQHAPPAMTLVEQVLAVTGRR